MLPSASLAQQTQAPQQPSVPQQPAGDPSQQMPQSGGQQPNFFEKLLPTVGSILGGLATAPLELAPGIGTALNIGAAGAGGAFGKFLENKLTGQAGGNGVLSSGLESGIGQGAGNLIGGLAKGGMGLLGNVADSGTNKLIQGQFAKGTLDSATAKTLNDMGITNADQVGQIAPMVTQSNGALSNGVQRGLQESDAGVDLSGLSNKAQNLVAENQMQLNPNSFGDINKTVQGALLKATNPDDVTQLTTKGAGGPVSTFQPGALQNVLPENAFNVTQNFEKLANKAYASAYDKMGNVANPDQLAKYNIFKGLADHTKDAAFGGNTPIPLSEGNKAQIISDLAPMKDVNPQAYNYHVGQVSNAQNLQDLRPIQKPMVDASRALGITQKMTDNQGGTSASNVVKTALPFVGGATAGPVGLAAGALPAILSSKAADQIGAGTLSKMSGILTNPTMQKIVKQVIAPGAAQTVANAPNYVSSQPATGDNTMAPGGLPQPQANPYATGGMPPGMSPSQLALQTGLIGLQDPYMAGSYAPLVQGNVGTLQKAAAADAALKGLEGTFQQAGGGQGLIGGLLSKLGGAVTGGPTQLYGQQSADLEKQLTGLGIPISSLPQVTNSAPAAQSGFSTLQAIINMLGGGQSVLSGVPPAPAGA